MTELWIEEKDCTGCGACYQNCFTSAISMVEDACGFLFPQIDQDLCVQCGACIRGCPVQKQKNKLDNCAQKPAAYALRHKDGAVLQDSSSGGAFTAIAQAFAAGEYAVFGAHMDAQLQVSHEAVYRLEDLPKLRKSKYVQSDTKDTYQQAKRLLEREVRVLYVGTPCQIAGLKSYLGADTPNLLTCDLVCEGVQSQRFFHRYLQFMEKKYGSPVKQVEFRSKGKHGWERSSFVLEFENGRKYDRICQTKDPAYMNSSLFQGGNRDSCYHCVFNRIQRQGDFTIGDLWGWRRMTPEWDDKKGLSLVLVNTQKAQALLPDLERVAVLRRVDFDTAALENPNLIRSTVAPQGRESYMKDLQQMEFAQLADKWLKPRNLARRILSHAKYYIMSNNKRR